MRGSMVVCAADRGSRFRDDDERRAAVDRLSPPSDVRANGGSSDLSSDSRIPPSITRPPSSKTRPKRFKDAMRERNGGLGDGSRRVRGDQDEDDEEEDPRELARKKRIERKESELADRLDYLVAVIREELGKPQTVLVLDARTRNIRFDALRHRLRNFGVIEIMFGLIKYYYAHWNEAEEAGGQQIGNEFERRLAGERKKVEGADTDTVNTDVSEAVARRMSEVLRSRDDDDAIAEAASAIASSLKVDDETSSGGASKKQQKTDMYTDADTGIDKQTDNEADNGTEKEKEESANEKKDRGVEDEAARRVLLRAAQLRATGVEPGSKPSPDAPTSKKGSANETLDSLAELARQYFSVDFVEDESGGKEMVVMTSPEFIGFLLVAIILSGRLSHFVMTTYLTTAVDPLLR